MIGFAASSWSSARGRRYRSRCSPGRSVASPTLLHPRRSGRGGTPPLSLEVRLDAVRRHPGRAVVPAARREIECDEYLFASTNQGAAFGPYIARSIPGDQDGRAGTLLGVFYQETTSSTARCSPVEALAGHTLAVSTAWTRPPGRLPRR